MSLHEPPATRFPDWKPVIRTVGMRQKSNIIRMLRFSPNSGIVRDLDGLPEVLGRAGTLEVRLARTKKDIKRAQKLRYKVFYEEMSAIPNPTAFLSRRDKDPFDRVCDHLLVLDYNVPIRPFRKLKPKVVGTYRLLRQDVAEKNFGFYSTNEFDLKALVEARPDKRFLELGRSCVLKEYRGKRTVDLLWQGIHTYMSHHRIDVVVGCASLAGIDPQKLTLPLSYLHHYASGPDDFTVKAVASRYVDMNLMPKEEINTQRALRALPPLIKGYVRVGAYFGNGAVIDKQFGTTDVLVILQVAQMDKRYVNHYIAGANRIAA